MNELPYVKELLLKIPKYSLKTCTDLTENDIAIENG